MNLAQYGEDRLVAALTRGLPLGRDVLVGAGDDCAVIGKRRSKRWQLFKADAVVEGIHFDAKADWRRVGWKALCRAISDIAAMGGTPEHALITLAVAREVEVSRVKKLYAGLEKAARHFAVGLVGGETVRSLGPLFVNVALTGSVLSKQCTLRSGGKPGDAVYVTGRLGGSLRGKHLDFLPRVAEAQWLVSHFKVHCMMDLSDGLGSDLPRLAEASRCGYEIWEERLPRNRGCSIQNAWTDGEDFELLFTIAERDCLRLEREWTNAFPDLLLSRIGAFLPSSVKRHRPSARGYDHFTER